MSTTTDTQSMDIKQARREYIRLSKQADDLIKLSGQASWLCWVLSAFVGGAFLGYTSALSYAVPSGMMGPIAIMAGLIMVLLGGCWFMVALLASGLSHKAQQLYDAIRDAEGSQ